MSGKFAQPEEATFGCERVNTPNILDPKYRDMLGPISHDKEEGKQDGYIVGIRAATIEHNMMERNI